MWYKIDGNTWAMNTLHGVVIKSQGHIAFVPGENWRPKDRRFVRVGRV